MYILSYEMLKECQTGVIKIYMPQKILIAKINWMFPLEA